MKIRTMTDRLEAVFTIIPTAHAIGDIGTDHGYMAVELLTRGKANSVIAGDVNKGPLASAAAYIKKRGLDDKIECRLGNGLQATKVGELQGAVICGMGGFLMRDIVDEGPELLDFYVLQPQNGQAELRQYMVQQGYKILRDIVMTDMGKMYQAFLAVRSDVVEQYISESGPITPKRVVEENPYDGLESNSMLWLVGAWAEQEHPELWREHIEFLIYQRQCAIDGMTTELAHTEKYQELEREIQELKIYA